MFSRYFLALCGLVMFAAVASASVAEEPKLQNQESLDAVEARNPGLAVAVRVLRAAFKWAAKHCLEQAANNCKQHWKHPKALVNCARGFLQANKGRCVAG